MAALAKALRTEVMADMDLRGLAQVLRSKGRGRDTVLAHITPREADMLKRMGGRGSTNPETGLPEFEEDYGAAFDFPSGFEGGAPLYSPPVASTGQEAGSDPEGQFAPAPVQPFDAQEYAGAYGLPGGAEAGGYEPGAYSLTAPGAQSALQSALDGVPGRMGGDGTPAPPPGTTPGALAVGGAAPPGSDQQYGPTQPPAPGAGAPAAGAAPTKDTSFLANVQRMLSDPATLARLGLGIGGTALGQLAAQRAQAQANRTMGADRATISAAQQQLRDLGAQYQQIGQEQIGAARRGELTPMSAQAYQAAQAQLAQQTARMGGVGQMQATGSLERLRQQLLSNQMSSGLSISNIGDQYVRQAIQSGLQGNLAVNQAARNYAQQIAQMQGQLYRGLGGVLGGTPSIQSPTTV